MNNVKGFTAKTEDFEVLSGRMPNGEDYKILPSLHGFKDIKTFNPEYQVVVMGECGNLDIFHRSWFDKPSTYKKKEVECYDEDFDDLVYNKVTKEGYGYYFIRLNTLSPEQKRHFNKYCSRSRTNFLNPTQDILVTSWDGRETNWWTHSTDLLDTSHPSWVEVSFNDIFKHRDEV